MGLKQAFGKGADFHYVEGDHLWTYRPGVDLHDADEMSKKLSKGKPFLDWFTHETDDAVERLDITRQQDPRVKVTYHDPEKACEKVLRYIEESGPIDVVTGLFEGCIVVHMLVALLAKRGTTIPWRLSLLFGSLPVRDLGQAALFESRKVSHPALFVFGRLDEYYFYNRTGAGCVHTPLGARRPLPSEDYYDNSMILEHNHGHVLPSASDSAIFARIVEEARWHCGLLPVPPTKIAHVPKPVAPPLLDWNTMQPRKIRVLALCGGHSCKYVIKYQTTPLRLALGKDVAEWTFVEGDQDWTWKPGEPVPTDMEEKIAQGKQLKNWYMDEPHTGSDDPRENREKQFDPSVTVEYFDIPETLSRWTTYITENGPFDVVVGFSQACIMMHLLIGSLKGLDDLPWRLSVFFNGMHIRDERFFHLVEAKSRHPTVHIFGKADEYYHYARDGFGTAPRVQEEYYENPVVLTHEQGHMFPTEEPRAKDIYDGVTKEIFKFCGLKIQ